MSLPFIAAVRRRRLMMLAVGLLVGMALLASSKTSGAQPLTEFYSMEGGFAASFPRKPDYVVEQMAGGASLHQYLVNLGRVAFLVAYSDEPTEESGNPQESLQRMQDVAVDGKTLIRQVATGYGPYPGRVFDYRDGAGVIVRQHIYLVRKRYYQIIFAGSDAQADALLAERFFASFRLL
jgi:hypothetical protein